MSVEDSYMKAIPETHLTKTGKIWSYPVSKHASVPKNKPYQELVDEVPVVGGVKKHNNPLQGTPIPPIKLEGNKQEGRDEILLRTTAITDEQAHVDVKGEDRAIVTKMGPRGNPVKPNFPQPRRLRQRNSKLRKTRPTVKNRG